MAVYVRSKPRLIVPLLATLAVGLIVRVDGSTAASAPRDPLAQHQEKEKAGGGFRPGQNPFDENTTLITNPDKFAWMMFVHVNRKAPHEGGKSNDALWETWASDPHTFPQDPNPKDPPKWPAAGGTDLRGRFRASLRLRSKVEAQRLRRHRALEQAQKGKPMRPVLEDFNPNQAGPAGFIPSVLEQVTRNRPAFEYIIKNHLWYLPPAADPDQKVGIVGRVQPGQPPIDFPRDSIAIKAEWTKLPQGADKTKYHWNVDDKGQVYVLLAIHITSKAIPNWVWATWEWVDNPGRSDFIGSRDAFGVEYTSEKTQPPTTQTFQAPNAQLGSVYPPGKVSKALDTMFREAFGGDQAWIDQWKNYRLKGTQIDFIDSTGRPTLLGNTISENGFVPTASCMTCHARASVTYQGPVAGTSGTFGGGFAPSVHNAGNVSYNGPPKASWFFEIPGIAGGIHQQGPATRIQTDFLWGIPLLASPLADHNPPPPRAGR